MSIRTTLGGALARFGTRIATKAAPLPSFSGGYGLDYQWTELARELRRIFDSAAQIDYADIDPGLNRVVQMCMSTIVTSSAKSRLRVSLRTAAGEEEDRTHSLARLLARPNEDLTLGEMLAATREDLARGNAYWWMERDDDGTGDVIALWLLPRPFVRARWPMDGSEFISFYEIWTGRGWQRLEKRDVIHFRRSLDRAPGFDGRYGVDPLRFALREVAIDERASDWAAVLLKNQGVPGAVISPKDSVNLTREQVKERVKAFQAAYTGQNRGTVMLATLALDIQKLGFNPKEIDFAEQHDLVESTICGLLDVPAGLVGVKVGIKAGMAKANSEEDTDRLWDLLLLPMEEWIVQRLTADLLPEFDDTTPEHFVDFDHSRVEALQEDQKEKAEIAVLLYVNGVASRWAAQRLASLEVDEGTVDGYCLPRGATFYEVGTSPVASIAEERGGAAALPPSAAKALRALPPAARLALKAALDAADVESADGAAEAFWATHAPPSIRRLLGAGEVAA